jgi:hypothetical protein
MDSTPTDDDGIREHRVTAEDGLVFHVPPPEPGDRGVSVKLEGGGSGGGGGTGRIRAEDMIEVRMPRRDWEALIDAADHGLEDFAACAGYAPTVVATQNAAVEALKVVKALVRRVPSAEL